MSARTRKYKYVPKRYKNDFSVSTTIAGFLVGLIIGAVCMFLYLQPSTQTNDDHLTLTQIQHTQNGGLQQPEEKLETSCQLQKSLDMLFKPIINDNSLSSNLPTNSESTTPPPTPSLSLTHTSAPYPTPVPTPSPTLSPTPATDLTHASAYAPPLMLQSYMYDVDTLIEKLQEKSQQNGVSIVWSMFGEDRGLKTTLLQQYCTLKFEEFVDFDLSQYPEIFEDKNSKTWIMYKNSNPNTYLISIMNGRDDGKVDVRLGVFKEVPKDTQTQQNFHHVVTLLSN